MSDHRLNIWIGDDELTVYCHEGDCKSMRTCDYCGEKTGKTGFVQGVGISEVTRLNGSSVSKDDIEWKRVDRIFHKHLPQGKAICELGGRCEELHREILYPILFEFIDNRKFSLSGKKIEK